LFDAKDAPTDNDIIDVHLQDCASVIPTTKHSVLVISAALQQSSSVPMRILRSITAQVSTVPVLNRPFARLSLRSMSTDGKIFISVKKPFVGELFVQSHELKGCFHYYAHQTDVQ
jgi:hypothetical protein